MKFLDISIKLLLAIGGLIVPLAILEGGAHLLGGEVLSVQDRMALVNENQLNPDDAPLWCKPRETFPPIEKHIQKVFALGGSSVYGCCGTVAHLETFPALLQEKLKKTKSYQVENYALSGRDSFYMRDCAKILLEAGERPTLWLYYAGHNDFINGRVGFPYISLFLQRNPNAFRLVNWILKNSKFTGLLKNISAPHMRPMKNEDFIKNRLAIFNQYKENIQDTHAAMKAAGGKMVLITLVSNLEHEPIFRQNALNSGQNESDAGWLFAEGMRLKKAKEFDAALARLKQARDWDLSGWRAPSEVNEFLRKFAEENKDSVILIDLEKKLDEIFPKEGINCNLFGEPNFCDYLHPNKRLHRFIANELEGLILKREQ